MRQYGNFLTKPIKPQNLKNCTYALYYFRYSYKYKNTFKTLISHSKTPQRQIFTTPSRPNAIFTISRTTQTRQPPTAHAQRQDQTSHIISRIYPQLPTCSVQHV